MSIRGGGVPVFSGTFLIVSRPFWESPFRFFSYAKKVEQSEGKRTQEKCRSPETPKHYGKDMPWELQLESPIF